MVAGTIVTRPEPGLQEPVPAPHAGTRRTILNLAHILGGEGLLRIANFVAAVAIARIDGPAVFGVYATALAYATIAVMIADNGLVFAAIKELSSNSSDGDSVYSRFVITKTGLFLLMLVGVAAVTWAYQPVRIMWTVGTLILLRSVLQSYSQLQIAVLKAKDRMTLVGPFQTVHAAIIFCGVLAVRYLHSGIVGVLVVLVCAQAIELMLETVSVSRLCRFRLAHLRFSACLQLVRAATAIGVTYTMATAVLRLDVIVLTWMATKHVVGTFAAAQTVVTILYVISWLFGSVLLPDLTRLVPSPRALDRFVRHWTRILLLTTVPLAALIAIFGPRFIPLVFGPSFADSGVLLSCMIFAGPFAMLNSLRLNRAMALSKSREFVALYALAALIGLMLSVGLGYRFGAIGIAFSAVAREIFIFIGFHARRFRHPLAAAA